MPWWSWYFLSIQTHPAESTTPTSSSEPQNRHLCYRFHPLSFQLNWSHPWKWYLRTIYRQKLSQWWATTQASSVFPVPRTVQEDSFWLSDTEYLEKFGGVLQKVDWLPWSVWSAYLVPRPFRRCCPVPSWWIHLVTRENRVMVWIRTKCDTKGCLQRVDVGFWININDYCKMNESGEYR